MPWNVLFAIMFIFLGSLFPRSVPKLCERYDSLRLNNSSFLFKQLCFFLLIMKVIIYSELDCVIQHCILTFGPIT